MGGFTFAVLLLSLMGWGVFRAAELAVGVRFF